jgi:hypothetical protein
MLPSSRPSLRVCGLCTLGNTAIFTNHLGAQLVPQFIPTFSPEGILTMSFGGQQADTGAALDASGKSSRPSECSSADYCSRRFFP